jgi:hypothetical protein
MRLDPDIEIEVAVASTRRALAALAGNAQLRSVGDAFRDADLDAMRHAARNAVLVVLELGEVELDLVAVERLVEGELDDGFVVASGCRSPAAARAGPAAARQAGEQIGQVQIVEDRLRTGKPLAPVRRGLKL